MQKKRRKRETIYLVNGEQMNSLHPDTFEIAERSIREGVRSGFTVKLGFEMSAESQTGERMWVIVRECLPGKVYLGTLDNDPVVLPMRLGDWVRFGPEHILDIED